MLAFSDWVAAASAAASSAPRHPRNRRLPLTVTYGPYLDFSALPLPAIMRKLQLLEHFNEDLHTMGFDISTQKSKTVGLFEITAGPHVLFRLRSPDDMVRLSRALVEEEDRRRDEAERDRAAASTEEASRNAPSSASGPGSWVAASLGLSSVFGGSASRSASGAGNAASAAEEEEERVWPLVARMVLAFYYECYCMPWNAKDAKARRSMVRSVSDPTQQRITSGQSNQLTTRLSH